MVCMLQHSSAVQHCSACLARLHYIVSLKIKRAHQSQDGRDNLFFDSYMIICCSR